jgi:hypothetical protein
MEHTILSGDRLDVFFASLEHWVCVEVKGKQSPELDILRGIFQCVKYTAVLKAQRHYLQNDGMLPHVRVVLVLGGDLPQEFEALTQILAVEVKTNITVPSGFVVAMK